MTAVTYVARRGLYGAHILGASYSVDLPLMQLAPSKKTEDSESVALSGKSQHVVFRRDEYWTLTTEQLEEGTALFNALYEFAESVDEFDVFSVDITGSVLVPVSVRGAKLTQNYQMERVGVTNEYTFSFTLKIVS